MPELPEMENYKLLLSSRVVGRSIVSVEVYREKSINVSSIDFTERLIHQKIIGIERRAKHLLFHINTGSTLLLHLMLGGWLFYGEEEDKPDRSIQLQLSFGKENLYFIGLRLGYLHIHTASGIKEALSDLGPEPLDRLFTEEQFEQLMTPRRGILKTLLVDQHLISGIGNHYSDEICFDAALLPMNKANKLSSIQIKRLYHSIQTILPEAVRLGGYMDEPFTKDDTLTGSYNAHCKVYDKEGASCSRCGHVIVKKEISSRKCFFCLNCQE